MKLVKKNSFGIRLILVVVLGTLALTGCGEKKKKTAIWPLALLGNNSGISSPASASNSGTNTTGSGSTSATGNGSATSTTGSGSGGTSGTTLSGDFNINSTFIRVGTVNGTTIPTQLNVSFSNALTSNTFVTISSSDQAKLSVANSGVTILSGQTNATVNLTGIAQSASVTLSAVVASTTKTTTVRVVDVTETPKLISLTPTSNSVSIGNSITLAVTLDIPSSAGGTVINLAINPPANGTVPATVTIPADQISATFSFIAVTGSSATVDATLGADNKTSNITIQ